MKKQDKCIFEGNEYHFIDLMPSPEDDHCVIWRYLDGIKVVPVSAVTEIEEKLDINIKEMSVDEGGLLLKLQGSSLHMLAASFVEVFKDTEAPNFIEFEFKDPNSAEHYALVMQRKSGLTPAQKLGNAEAELEQLRKELEEAKELINKIESIVLKTTKLQEDYTHEDVACMDESLDEISGKIETFKAELNKQSKGE